MPVWRNWQTRTTQNRVPQGVSVRPRPPVSKKHSQLLVNPAAVGVFILLNVPKILVNFEKVKCNFLLLLTKYITTIKIKKY
jgi:hypothetical protein